MPQVSLTSPEHLMGSLVLRWACVERQVFEAVHEGAGGFGLAPSRVEPPREAEPLLSMWRRRFRS